MKAVSGRPDVARPHAHEHRKLRQPPTTSRLATPDIPKHAKALQVDTPSNLDGNETKFEAATDSISGSGSGIISTKRTISPEEVPYPDAVITTASGQSTSTLGKRKRPEPGTYTLPPRPKIYKKLRRTKSCSSVPSLDTSTALASDQSSRDVVDLSAEGPQLMKDMPEPRETILLSDDEETATPLLKNFGATSRCARVEDWIPSSPSETWK
jgi:hypothetical protein